MRCPSCSNNFIIRTDPKNTDYDYVEGIKKKEMDYDPTVRVYQFRLPLLHSHVLDIHLITSPVYPLPHRLVISRIGKTPSSVRCIA